MNIKPLLFHVGLGFALAIAGVVAGTSPAQAQRGNLSDITGNIITTSDIAGGFSPSGDRLVNLSFRTNEIRDAVNTAATSVNQQLASRLLPIVANGLPTAIPESVQQNVECAFTSNINVGDCTAEIERGLVNAGVNLAIAQNLATSLQGLTAKDRVEPGRLVAVVRAYNALINSSSAEFLSNPPEELRAIQSVLSILLNAAYVNTQ
ncbi:MAG TPA: hypothetical protein V6D43_10765 [Candidatus Sericytochromatia bacterium]